MKGTGSWSILWERKITLRHLRLIAGLLLLSLTTGCKAQTIPLTRMDAKTSRRIETMVRSQFSLPADYGVTIGTPKSSNISGYDTLPITLSHGAKAQTIDFLLSTDGKTLARMETFDLTNDPSLNIDVNGRPVRGNPAAKVTLINFDDMECPYCGRMHEELFSSTFDRYKNVVRFIYKDDPLIQIHPWATHAAVNANCLAAQNGNAYWSFVDYIHAHGQEVAGNDHDAAKSFAALDRIARQQAALAKLDESRLDACLQKQDESQVRESAKLAGSLGVDGTPALFINGERLNGAVPEDQLWQAIDRALLAEGIQPPAAPVQAAQPATQPGK
jgi:protein-disulfide isomerase